MLLLTCPSVRSSTTIFCMSIVTIEPLRLDSGNWYMMTSLENSYPIFVCHLSPIVELWPFVNI